MSDRSDPFSEFLGIVSGPVTSVIRSFDQLRKGADELMKGLENFNATMANLNETASTVNRLLADVEEPVRAAIPQLTRTIKMAEEWTDRLSGPIDQVVPGITRLADTLNSPVLGALPRDLGDFIEVINDLAKRMAPLGQLAEQAGSIFGLRIPGFPPRAPAAPQPVAATPPPPPPEPKAIASRSAAPASRKRTTTAPKTTTAKKSAAKKTAAKKTGAKKSTAKQSAAAKKTSARG